MSYPSPSLLRRLAAVAVVAGALAACTHAPASSLTVPESRPNTSAGASAVNADSLARAWMDTSVAMFTTLEVRLPTDTRRRLKTFVTQGASRLAADRASAAAIESARKNLMDLVSSLLDNVTSSPSTGGATVDTDFFDATTAKLCPFYPFC